RYFNGNTKTWETSNMRTYSKVSKGMFEVYKDLLSTYLNNTVTTQNNDYTLRFTIKKEEKNNETLFEVLFGNTTCQSVSSVVIDSLDAPFATATLKPLLDLIKSNKSSIKATGGTENNSAVLGCSFEGITYNSMSLTSLVFSGYTIDKIAKLDKNMLELCEKQVPLPTSDPWEIFHTFYYATLFAKGEITLNKESNVCTFSRVIDQYYRQKTVCMKLYFA
ncbi:MAG TPA: hypothetical protein VI959_03635, partial [Alphaproteobacteria bacterium]|nr:hypothetical protein [Alphaproteobacteria bacterium]